MDLYGSWEAPSTPSVEASHPLDGVDAEDGEGDPSTPRARGEGQDKVAPTLEEEIEQMSTFVSGVGKNLGSYWGQFRRQVRAA